MQADKRAGRTLQGHGKTFFGVVTRNGHIAMLTLNPEDD
jgi:hypothetical protein